jgi:hypothetical protein
LIRAYGGTAARAQHRDGDSVPCLSAWHYDGYRRTCGSKNKHLDFNDLMFATRIRAAFARQRNMLVAWGSARLLVSFIHHKQRGRPLVDFALKRLDVLAVFAAFLFVGAILLGAF